MIHLHHLDGRSVYVNPDLIERFEVEPTTVLMMVDERRIPVRESPSEVTAAMRDYRAEVIVAVEGQQARQATAGGLRLLPPVD